MPLYEYLCKKCGHRFEKIQKFSDKMVKKCPECGGQVEQVISAPAVQFKGSGWYVTDYAKKSSSPGSSGDSGSRDKTEDKPKSDSSSKEASAKESSSKASSSKESSSQRKLFERNRAQGFGPAKVKRLRFFAKPPLHDAPPTIALLQLPLELIFNHREQMHPRILPGDAVRLVRIDHQPELFPCIDQRVDHLNAVLEVHIVVARAVHQQ